MPRVKAATKIVDSAGCKRSRLSLAGSILSLHQEERLVNCAAWGFLEITGLEHQVLPFGFKIKNKYKPTRSDFVGNVT